MKNLVSILTLLVLLSCRKASTHDSSDLKWGERGIFSKERLYQFYAFHNNMFCLYENSILVESLKNNGAYSPSTGTLDPKAELLLSQTLFIDSKPVNPFAVTFEQMKDSNKSLNIAGIGGFVAVGSITIGVFGGAATGSFLPMVLGAAGASVGGIFLASGAMAKEVELREIEIAKQRLSEKNSQTEVNTRSLPEKMKDLETIHSLVASLQGQKDSPCPEPKTFLKK